MKGLVPLFLGIFGTFAFSWVGLTVIPNWQIGHLNPQMEEDGTDVYPQPQSGMAERGRRVYAANGCIYCHSQQIRADYAADDIERKWGDRRSTPRDYIFERQVFLGKMRMGPDLANVGARAPAEAENAPSVGGAAPASSPGQKAAAPGAASGASPAPAASPASAGSPGHQPAVVPAGTAAPSGGNPNPSPGNAGSPPAKNPSPAAAGSPAPSTSPPAASPAAPKAPAPPGPNALPGSTSAPAAVNASPGPAASPAALPTPSPASGEPPIYSVAWHHKHLYSPRSINIDSDMPSYRFLYEKRQISDAPSVDALQLTGSDAPPEGWEIVPTFDAKCLVAYLISRNQSHPLKGITSAAPAAPSPSPSPAPAK
jgi:cbb3-type cytochrome oxidase cytochrome c subunit